MECGNLKPEGWSVHHQGGPEHLVVLLSGDVPPPTWYVHELVSLYQVLPGLGRHKVHRQRRADSLVPLLLHDLQNQRLYDTAAHEFLSRCIAKHTKVDMIWVAGRSPTLVSQNLKATTLTYLAITL